jgi:hypothetical protein
VNSKLNEDINVDPFAPPTNKNNKTNGKQLAITTTTKNSNKSSRQNIFKNKSASFDEDYDD